MKRIYLVFSLVIVIAFIGCNDSESSSDIIKSGSSDNENELIDVNITVGTKVFSATFYDNESTQAFIAQMPLTVNMSDLNRNEKYFDLSENLPASDTERPSTIHAGEIMCWSGNTLVLFYETFSNSYGGYVRLGYIDDVSGLAETLGYGDIAVTFSRH